jgi:SAM-dependent methyltransferase/uncharacterized protein YbaR (Trm112 family)
VKLRLLDLLACPDCGCELSAQVRRYLSTETTVAIASDRACDRRCAWSEWRREDGGPNCPACYATEIVEGQLDCSGCRRTFAIRNGVPRLLPLVCAETGDGAGDLERRTADSFSYQWTAFAEMAGEWERDFLHYIAPRDRRFFPEKIGLDAGCGFGRHTRLAVHYGAEMVGMDFSLAADAAYTIVGDLPRCHVVQGDIYRPPFRVGVFDFVYSIGVLHHLRDARGALARLVELLRSPGEIFVWVYKQERAQSAFRLLWLIRRLTVRLPYGTLRYVAGLFALLERVIFHWPYRTLRGSGRLPSLAARIYFKYDADTTFHLLYSKWFDNLSVPIYKLFTREQVEQWFRDAGLEGVVVADDWNGRATGIKPLASTESRRSGPAT